MIHPIFSDVMGHETILRVLTHHLENPAHGYLFTGPHGVGKRMAAERFARVLLGQPQGLPLQAHPDFIRLTREEGAKEISIKQVRQLIERVSLTAARGGRKVVLIEQANQLNEEGANALLKSVEEPTPSLVYLFVTERPERLPATLRSRLVSIRFERPPHLMAHPQKDESNKNLFMTLIQAPLGQTCAALEKLSQSCEAQEESEQAWRAALQSLMPLCAELFATNPEKAVQCAQGLTHAWHLVGSSLSPRLALEWAAVPSSVKQQISLPSFLQL